MRINRLLVASFDKTVYALKVTQAWLSIHLYLSSNRVSSSYFSIDFVIAFVWVLYYFQYWFLPAARIKYFINIVLLRSFIKNQDENNCFYFIVFFLYHISWFTFLAVLVNVKPIYLIGANWKMVSSRANNECTDTEYGRRARSWRINYSEKILIHNVT